MTIKLVKLTLINFKGIVERTINFGFENTNIYGANESGKSTLYTAFNWLITGKDEQDRKDFEIKNTNKKELNTQAHEVEAVLLVNGRHEKLKRVYLEKWVKQKGQSQKTFEGHKTEFWYNDVPCNLSEFQAKVDAIIDAKIIKLVTNPTYFNSLKWEDQRRGLLGIAGNITDTDIFNAIATPQNDYGALINTLNSGETVEELKKKLAAKKLLLKKSATEYAPRIDEAKRNMPESLDWPSLEAQVKEVTAQISDIDAILADASLALAEKQKGLMAKQKELHAKQTALANIRFTIKSELQAKQNAGTADIAILENEIKAVNQQIAAINRDIQNAETNKEAYQRQIDSKNEIIVRLRNEWNIINAEKFEFDESKCECPTCKQSLPVSEIETKRSTLLKNFNQSVTERKNDRVALSNQVKAEIAQLQENIVAINENDFSVSIQPEQQKLVALQYKLSELKKAEGDKPAYDIEAATDKLLDLNGEALDLKDAIAQLQIDIEAQSNSLQSESDQLKKEHKAQLQIDLDALKKELAIKETIERTEARILQLEKEEQANAQAIADLEQQEFEVETYTRAKMDILQNRVNSKFKYVQFRLFETQVNGAIAETCVCEYKGVPYPTLNTAAKLTAGLDVLNTLSNHYNVYAPVFCDNRESVTTIPNSSSQIISLFVSPADKELRVEDDALETLKVA